MRPGQALTPVVLVLTVVGILAIVALLAVVLVATKGVAGAERLGPHRQMTISSHPLVAWAPET